MFNVLSHQGTINQHYIEIPPHPGQDGYQEKKNAGRKESKFLFTAGGNINKCSYYGNWCGGSSKI
jgi:hypothetical protein